MTQEARKLAERLRKTNDAATRDPRLRSYQLIEDAATTIETLAARVEELEGAFKYVAGLLPGAAGAIDREADTYVLTCMVNIGELRRVRALRSTLKGTR